MRRFGTLAPLLFAVLGCQSDPAPPTVEVQLIAPDGSNPLAEGGFSSILVEVAQAGRPTTRVRRDLEGDVDLAVEIDSLGGQTSLRVAFEGATDLIGAPPTFVPGTAGGLVRIVMGEPGSCVRVPDAAFTAPRSQTANARIDTFLTVAAGLDDALLSSRVEFLDLLRMFSGELDDLVGPRGRAQGANLGENRFAIISEQGAASFDLSIAEDRESAVSLHPGAGVDSAVVSYAGGAAVIGGSLDGAAVSDVSWIAADGRVHRTQLSAPRSGAVAIALGDRVLVAGGTTGAVAEMLEPASDMGAPFGESEPLRLGATILADDEAFWLVGGVDDLGEPRTDHVSLLGCPGACRAEPGVEPAVEAVDVTGQGGWLVRDADVSEARFDGRWSLQPRFTLTAPRRRPALVVFESGVLVVAAGEGRSDVEMCFPDELTPVD